MIFGFIILKNIIKSINILHSGHQQFSDFTHYVGFTPSIPGPPVSKVGEQVWQDCNVSNGCKG